MQTTNFMPAKKFGLIALLLLLAAANSQALTLGRLRGAALVGQALDVSVQVQMDTDENPANLCFEADVFHGDTRQEPSRVQVTAEPGQASQSVNLRIQSQGLIDEPVVTVYLRAGCAQKISRRYVLLADVVSEPLAAAPLPPRAAQVPLIVPATSSVPASSSTGAEAAGVPGLASTPQAAAAGALTPRAQGSAAPTTVRKPRPAARSKPPAAAAPVRRPARPKAPPATPPTAAAEEKLIAGRTAGQSRLKLDPLEVLSERVATLESTTASAPAEVAARQAAEAQRIESLETSLKNLLALAAKNDASLADVKAQLQRAESERYQNPLVYGLAVLLLLCFVLLLFLLTRRNRQGGGNAGNWWSGTGADMATVGSPHTGTGPVRQSGFSPMSAPGSLADEAQAEAATQQIQRSGPRSIPGPITQVDVSLVEMSESTFDRLMQSGTTHSAVRKPKVEPAKDAEQPVPVVNRRSINSEDLFDIRQRAEFFVSLGQTDQAVRILETRIAESGESSPLAYLDLLKIFHSLGLRADFRQVREDFSRLFNASVPEFSTFSEEGKGLEDYPELVVAICATWGTPNAFATLESGVFRDQWNTQREPLDLAAFRDLLLLHAVAQTVAAAVDGVSVPAALTVAYSPAATYPVSVPQPAGDAATPLPPIDGLPELDIDLSDLHIPKQATPDFSDTKPVQKTAPPVAAPAVDAAVPADGGNLIDFDLSDALPKAKPKPGFRNGPKAG